MGRLGITGRDRDVMERHTATPRSWTFPRLVARLAALGSLPWPGGGSPHHRSDRPRPEPSPPAKGTGMIVGLREQDTSPDPISQFRRWFTEAEAAGVLDRDAMVVATADRGGDPSAR